VSPSAAIAMDLPELDDDDSLNPDASAAPAADEPSDVTASLVNKVPGVLPVCGPRDVDRHTR